MRTPYALSEGGSLYSKGVNVAASAPGRALRSALAAALIVALAASAHSLGGGSVGGPISVAMLLLITAPACWYAAARRLNAGQFALLLGLGQLGLHGVLAAMAPTAAGSATRLSGHHGIPGLALSDPASAGHVGGHLTPNMLGWHVLATVVTALALAYGEALLWFVVEALLATMGKPRLTVPVEAPAAWAAPVRPLRLLTGHRSARGPPAWVY